MLMSIQPTQNEVCRSKYTTGDIDIFTQVQWHCGLHPTQRRFLDDGDPLSTYISTTASMLSDTTSIPIINPKQTKQHNKKLTISPYIETSILTTEYEIDNTFMPTSNIISTTTFIEPTDSEFICDVTYSCVSTTTTTNIHKVSENTETSHVLILGAIALGVIIFLICICTYRICKYGKKWIYHYR
eukprot:UN30622